MAKEWLFYIHRCGRVQKDKRGCQHYGSSFCRNCQLVHIREYAGGLTPEQQERLRIISTPSQPQTPHPNVPANQTWPQHQNVNIDGKIEIFVNACGQCGQAFTVNVKNLEVKEHRVNVICPKCGFWQDTHTDK